MGNCVTESVEWATKSFWFVVSTIIFWTVFPLVYLLATPLYLYRIFVKCLAKLIHPDWVEMMNIRDVFVSEDMNNKKGLTSVVSLVFVLGGTPDLDQIRKSFLEKVLLQQNKYGEFIYTKFKYFSEDWLGFPFWKLDQNFSLNNHIRLCEETKGKSETTEEEFLQVMGPLSTKLFSPQMPPWEMLVVENYKPKSEGHSGKLGQSFVHHHLNQNSDCTFGDNFNNNNNNSKSDSENDKERFALVFRFHHTLCDGFSVVKLVVENFGGLPKQDVPRAPRRKPSIFRSFLLFLEIFLQVGYTHLKILLLDYDFNSWHVFQRKLTGKWHTVMTDPVPFSLARETSKNVGVATTTVLFGAIAGGVQRYFKESGKRERDIPDLMRGLFPFPVRGHPLDGMINHWTFANIPLPLKTTNVVERLKKMNRELNHLKSSPVPGITWAFSPFYMAVPRWLVNLWGRNRITTMTLSNFPGPKKQIIFFEKWPIEDTMYWLPRLRGNASLHLAILTYNGSIRITLTVDKVIFPQREDAKKLINCIQEELVSFHTLFNAEQGKQMEKHSIIVEMV